jgi:indolepyruvate ferredoxin oxidoreductase, beta subunit
MNIVLAAVGGQGALLASKILGSLAQEMDYDVKVSEVHGMSQRGGSVVTYVKFGRKVHSPIVEKGTADILLAFEKLEGARYVDYLKEGGTMIVNTQEIAPMPVIVGQLPYPKLLFEEIKNINIKFMPVDALSLAKDAGNIKAVNVVLIGVMAGICEFDKDLWISSLKKTVPAKLHEVNLKAFELGYLNSSKFVNSL